MFRYHLPSIQPSSFLTFTLHISILLCNNMPRHSKIHKSDSQLTRVRARARGRGRIVQLAGRKQNVLALLHTSTGHLTTVQLTSASGSILMLSSRIAGDWCKSLSELSSAFCWERVTGRTMETIRSNLFFLLLVLLLLVGL